MDILARLLQAQTPAPTDNFWFRGTGVMTDAGIHLDEEGAKKLSAWFRGRDLLATALAMLPLHLYERLPEDEGAVPARQHPLYDVLHRKPHPALPGDSFTWRRQGMFDLIDHGWAYDRIEPGAKWGLVRLDPTRVRPMVIRNGSAAGRYLFRVTQDDGTPQTLTQDEVFFRRLGDGRGILDHARESLGLARVTDQYASKVFGAGTLSAGHIETPGEMNPESARALAESFKTAAGDWHFPKVIPAGAKYVPNDGLTPERAQLILSRKFSINDIARWLGLPPHMLGDLDRATFSNIEHQGQEFVTYSLGPWLSLWEFAINDQLVLQPNRFYAEFNRDALVRGDLLTRWQAYQIQLQTGTVVRNEVRRKENMNKLPGLDKPLEPTHLTGKQPRPAARGRFDQDEAEDDRAADSVDRARAIVVASASRLLLKEVAEVRKLAVRHAADSDAFAAAVTEFYAAHAPRVAQWLQLPLAQAERYCAGQAGQLVAGSWLSALEQWTSTDYAAGLAALALEEGL